MGNFKFDSVYEKNGILIEGLYEIIPLDYEDSRGCFMEIYNERDYINAGIKKIFVQDNQSISKKGVLRGLHTQKYKPQGKLVRVVEGSVFDVAVDLRKRSESFKMWYGVNLSSENKKMLFIPPGFAHGFLVLSNYAIFSYKCTSYYDPSDEIGIIWNDTTIGIKWPLEDNIKLSLSDKDLKNNKFENIDLPY